MDEYAILKLKFSENHAIMIRLRNKGEWIHMLYLILAIVTSAMISSVMRVSEKYSKNNMGMLAANYLTCAALSWINVGSFNVFGGAGGAMRTVGLGIVCGVLFLAAFVLLKWNIGKNGVVLPATFMKLGVIVPTVLAITVFGESPKVTQMIGIAAALGAIFLMQGRGKQRISSISGLIVLMLAGGMADAMAKVYEQYGEAALSEQYLLFTFATALVICVVMCAVKKQKIAQVDVLFGAAVGIPNYLSSKFLLLSLNAVPAVAAFPTFSVGTIVLVTLAGVLLFKEKLEKRKLIALGVILVALALLNI